MGRRIRPPSEGMCSRRARPAGRISSLLHHRKRPLFAHLRRLSDVSNRRRAAVANRGPERLNWATKRTHREGGVRPERTSAEGAAEKRPPEGAAVRKERPSVMTGWQDAAGFLYHLARSL